MLLTALCCLTLASQQTPAPHDGPSGTSLLAIYQEHAVYLNGVQPLGGQGQSLRYDRLGDCSWKVLDGGVKGVPCTIYKCDGIWNYKTTIRNTAMRDYHEVGFTSLFDVGLDGIPIHSESHFQDVTEHKARVVDVVADYTADHIDETVTTDGQSFKQALYPTFGMERFAGMFEPIMRSGLIQHDSMDCAVLHPYTGEPYLFTLKVKSRFTGHYFSLPQAGYCIEILGAQGNGRAFLSRQGQLLKVDLGNKIDASMEEAPLAPERAGWGTFDITDWDKASDETNPERPTYHTLVVPVLFKDPHILFPVPCALTE
jgi:hypothetical protein